MSNRKRRPGTDRGRYLAGLRASNAAGLHTRRTPRGQSKRAAIGESRQS